MKLNEPSADGCDVALLIGESDPTGSFRVLEFGVSIDASVAYSAIKPVHDHSELNLKMKSLSEKSHLEVS